MEPLTALTLIAVPVIAGVAALALVRVIRSVAEPKNSLAETARARAAARYEERAFRDTIPDHDPYDSSSRVTLVTEIDDKFDGRSDLDSVQLETIELIFDGFPVQPTQPLRNLGGATPFVAAGVPISQSVFADDNQVSQVDKDDIWGSRPN